MAYRIIRTTGPPFGSPPIREYPGPPSAKGVIIPPARKIAKLAVCPSVEGRCEGFLFRRSWRNTRPTGVFGTQWFARALASPRRVHRFDLEIFPKQTVLVPAPLSLAPAGAAGQKTARILDMNGGEPLFFKVLKGESISPFNIWKWQRVFVRVLPIKFVKYF